MANLKNPDKNEIKLEKPYLFLEKQYASLNELFWEMMQPQNYKTALEEWESGKIADSVIEQLQNKKLKEFFTEIQKWKISEDSDDRKKNIKIQLGLANALMNPNKGFIVDGVEVTPDNLKKYIEYFISFREKKQSTSNKKYLEISETTPLLKRIFGENELVKKLESMSKMFLRYASVLPEYLLLTDNKKEKLEKEILRVDEETLKRREWAVGIYKELIKRADSKKLMVDRKRAAYYISKQEPVISLGDIPQYLESFKKKYRGATGNWASLYHQEELDEMESLLLLSAPKDVLVLQPGYRVWMFAGTWVLVLLSMMALIIVPYYLMEDAEKWQEESILIHQIGTAREDSVKDVQLDAEGNFFIGGYTSGFGMGGKDLWLLKMDMDKGVGWSMTIGGDKDDILNVLVIPQSQNFFLGGMTDSLGDDSVNSLLVKLNRSGHLLWSQFYDMGGEDEIIGLAELLNGNLVITGKFSPQPAEERLFIGFLDREGNLSWKKIFAEVPDGFGAAVVAEKNNFMVFGNVMGNSKVRDLVILSVDEQGELLWKKLYRNLDLRSQKLVLPLEDGILFAGQSLDLVGVRSYVDVIKIDYRGNELWSRRIPDQENLQPLSLSSIEDSSTGASFLLMGRIAHAGQFTENVFFRVMDNGDYLALATKSKSKVNNSVLSFIRRNRFVLIGKDDYGSERQQDIWVMQRDVPLPMPE